MSLESGSPVVASPHIHKLLERLHAQSTSQETALGKDNTWGKIKSQAVADPSGALEVTNDVMRDKFIALETDKSQFVYQLLRATRALNAVEVGTSFGVSTIYLALAIGQNATDAGKGPGEAKVLGTEWEATKATKAREFWSEAGEEVNKWIELLEGDCRETLNEKLGNDRILDFVLMDSKLPNPRVAAYVDLTGISLESNGSPHYQSPGIQVEAWGRDTIG